jgi:hypothetical protein
MRGGECLLVVRDFDRDRVVRVSHLGIGVSGGNPSREACAACVSS